MHAELKKILSQSLNSRAELEQKLIEQAWENETFKQELINNPKAVINRESRQQLPEELEVEVLQETANKVYLVLPENPAQIADEAELSEENLERVAGGVNICPTGWGFGLTGVTQCVANNSETEGAQEKV